ncbi:rod shape-determining protein [Spiroplasma cantharicola]|uniref:Cell shape determining protein MreB n=1 Tax=Spiroplasma cantharicola TaxID=362837 RepID=A0A0M3SJK9_9MOLU|nr:rod shape-determining protein [Spiroplasma cantharicola]ALD66914.1 cell shape determining protein MreB [Spiroplasma cantharicola]
MARASLRTKRHIAIDIGTSKTRIFIEKLGMVFNEASLIAIDYKTKKVISVGDATKKFVGKLSGTMQIKSLLKRGILTDMNLLKKFLSTILSKYEEEVKSSVVTLACPISMSDIERRALIESIKSLGVSHVVIEDDIKLALLGAGYNIYGSDSYMCLELGAGKATIGLVNNGETINYKWTKACGEAIDQEIIKVLKTKEGILIGDVTAEAIKIAVGSVLKNKEPLKTKAYGYDLNSSRPREIEVEDKDISKLILSVFGNITNTITALLEETQSEIAGDIIKNGLIITGGLARIPGVKLFFENFFEIPVIVAKNSSTATIEGAIMHKEKTFDIIEAMG